MRAHLVQFDHRTSLLAPVLVAANVRLGSRRISAAAAGLLGAALVYDLYELRAG